MMQCNVPRMYVCLYLSMYIGILGGEAEGQGATGANGETGARTEGGGGT